MHQEKQTIEKLCKVLKLTNGETIIGNISKETVSYIDVETPLKILVMIHPQESKMNMSVLKWDPTFDYNFPVRVYKTCIVACAEPNEMMMQNYEEILAEANSIQEEENVDGDKGDEITELNDVLSEILKNVNPKTMH